MDIKKIVIPAAFIIMAAAAIYGFFRPARIIETTRTDTKLVEKLKKDIERINSQAWTASENYKKQLAAATSSQMTLDKDTEVVETFNAEGKRTSRITRKKETATRTTASTTASTETTASTASGSASTTERDRSESSTVATSTTQTKKDIRNYKMFSLGAGINTDRQPVGAGSVTLFDTIEIEAIIQSSNIIGLNAAGLVKLRF